MGKGKVHPSPPASAGAVGGGETAEAVLLRLLPVAVLAMAAPLGAEGKEVLAYLVLASLRSSAPAASPEGRVEREVPGGGGGGGSRRVPVHRPELGCGCFGCYTAYWSRWDGSPEPDRAAIHRAIEAFEEHLARKEQEQEEDSKAGSRRRKKRAAKEKAGKEKGKAPASAAADPAPPPPAGEPEQEGSTAVVVAAGAALQSREEVRAEEEGGSAASPAAAGGEDGGGGVVEEERRRRGWGGVAGVLNWRGWVLWGPTSQ